MAFENVYEIWVSNEDTRDQVVRLLDENYNHPNVTIMAAANNKPVDKCLRSRIKRYIKVSLTRIWLNDAPKSIEEKTFFKQLGYTVHVTDGEVYCKLPVNLELHPEQNQTNVSENDVEYALDRSAVIEINMPPLTEIKIQLFIK